MLRRVHRRSDNAACIRFRKLCHDKEKWFCQRGEARLSRLWEWGSSKDEVYPLSFVDNTPVWFPGLSANFSLISVEKIPSGRGVSAWWGDLLKCLLLYPKTRAMCLRSLAPRTLAFFLPISPSFFLTSTDFHSFCARTSFLNFWCGCSWEQISSWKNISALLEIKWKNIYIYSLPFFFFKKKKIIQIILLILILIQKA